MGISKDAAKFLFYSAQQGVSFKNVLTLGRQCLYADAKDIKTFINYFKSNAKDFNAVEFENKYSEPLFHMLGAETVDSIDYSDYEGATIVHDLNNPLPNQYKNSFSVVVDGGSIEHIFNFPSAIKSCMEALKVGGHYIGFTPTNNACGHGFYQFSPEVYFRIFDQINGFKIKLIAAHINGSFDWYKITDPAEMRARVELRSSRPLSLIILAEKIESREIFSMLPQQSDFVSMWNGAVGNKKKYKVSDLIFLLYEKLPRPIKVIIRKVYYFIFFKKNRIYGIGLKKISCKNNT